MAGSSMAAFGRRGIRALFLVAWAFHAADSASAGPRGTAPAEPASGKGAQTMAEVPGGYLVPPFLAAGKVRREWVKPFRLDKRPVAMAEFLAFVRDDGAWKRSRVKRLFADSTYLAEWEGDEKPPPGERAVTQVSWYAAKAYCASQGKRLPTTAEWERTALQVPQGADSAAYFARILEWYSAPASGSSLPKRPGSRNAFGIRDLFGNVWEWTSDFNAYGPSDRGEVSARDASFFCGGAAGQARPGTDYATFMRYAFRSSLRPEFTLSSLGFRCAQDP